MSDFYEKLDVMADQDKFLCVGLDPRPDRFPEIIRGSSESITEQALLFGSAIVEAVSDVAAAIKPNEAFWQALAAEGQGTAAYERFIADVHSINPELVVIGDAKRMDIGDTNGAYAVSEFDDANADALTVNPYFGHQAAEPLLDRENRGIIPVVRTSNPGAGLVQDLPQRLLDLASLRDENEVKLYNDQDITGLFRAYDRQSHVPFYAVIATQIRKFWNANNNVGVVAGASPSSMGEIAQVRAVVGDEIPILVPGVGAQGGEARVAAALARNSIGRRFLINESRSIIYASDGSDFADVARDRAIDSSEQILAGIYESS